METFPEFSFNSGWLEEARLPGEDVNDTLLRLIKRYEQQEQIGFIKRQKKILGSEGFTPIDESKE